VPSDAAPQPRVWAKGPRAADCGALSRAHEITNKVTAEILDVEPGEAEWSIQLVEQLIDYFYVKLVEEDRKIADLNKKLVEAGKPPILQPPTAQLDEAKIEGAEADPRQPTNDR
jgi:hypothetical protein